MPESESFWNLYWEIRLEAMQDLGKREAVLALSRLIRLMAERADQRVRILELGCGEGQIIGTLVEAHAQVPGMTESLGLDYRSEVLAKCRRDYPYMHFIEADFTDPALPEKFGRFEIVMLVNALHEVYSAEYSTELGEVDIPLAKQKVEAALAGAVRCVAPGGYLALFDGLEPPGDPFDLLCVRFANPQARDGFDVFAQEYRPFKIAPRELGENSRVELSRRDFTRYITKSIFLGKRLWQTERLESYQYFTEAEFRQAFARLELSIRQLDIFTVNGEKWRSLVEIETPGFNFPAEHIWILGQKK